MGLLERLKLSLKPLRRDDRDFGPLLFMYISNAPEKSYWEAEWTFPPVGNQVSIGLDGDKSGPAPEARAFYLSRVGHFERTMALVRPRLDAVCRQWLGRPLAEDLWEDVKLSGFGVEDPEATPVSWDVFFTAIFLPAVLVGGAIGYLMKDGSALGNGMQLTSGAML